MPLSHLFLDSQTVLLALIQLTGGTLSTPVAPAPVEHQQSSRMGLHLFVFVLLLIVGGAKEATGNRGSVVIGSD